MPFKRKSTTAAAINKTTKITEILMMILRFFLEDFLAFLAFFSSFLALFSAFFSFLDFLAGASSEAAPSRLSSSSVEIGSSIGVVVASVWLIVLLA